MADTLRSLAGDRFYDRDIVRSFHVPIEPEQQVLDRYVFVPHVRSGIAAALDTPFVWGAAARASVEMAVPVVDDTGTDTAKMTIHVFGPGDVAELATHQVIRTWPRPDAHDTEVDDLVQVEFDRPELPWLFTPTGPNGGRLVPWITLVIAESGTFEWGASRGTLRTVGIRRDQLQPLGEAWAWAHAQVMGAKGATAVVNPTLQQRISGANAAHNLSRLVCPRRLAPRTAYTAFVVPTFSAGRAAGLGLGAVTTLEPSWGTSGDFGSGAPDSMVSLPAYFAWSFATGENGNFEELARRIRPAVAPPGVGRRRVDATRPWDGAALGTDDPGAEMVVEGPVVSPQDPEDYPEQHWPSEAEQQWDPAVSEELVSRLNRADEQAHQEDPGPPLVGPPLYGSNHARQPRLDTGAAGAAQPLWFRELNTDPRHRVVGGLGTRVVQHDQEALMASAWNQVIGVEEANRQLRLAQLAKYVSGSLHRRHLGRLDDAGVLKVTSRVHQKLLDAPGVTIHSAVDTSSLPTPAVSGAYRRMLRLRGPVVRVALTDVASPVAAAEVVDRLTVQHDGLTTDWVLAYSPPDGITSLSKAARARITPELVERLAPGTSVEEFAEQLESGVRSAGLDQVLTTEFVDRLDLAQVNPAATTSAGAMSAVLAGLPSPQELEEDHRLARSAVFGALQVRALAGAGRRADVGEYVVPVASVRRLDLPARPRDRDRDRELVADAGELAEWTRGYVDFAAQFAGRLAFEDLERQAEQFQERLTSHLGRTRELFPAGLKAVAETIVRTDEFAEPVRQRLSVPPLDLVTRLDPAVTVPARIHARLTAGTGRMPSWLRPDWFADQRIEPVMASPRFDDAMYEALDRYDRDWMIPGLGLIKRPDMATLLETNSRFVEAFMVGLNHEMGRELLWREYPADQRGTYFRSFWTGRPELGADLHEPLWRSGGLGAHLDPRLDGRIVMLVRGDLVKRYPGVVAHAVRQAQEVDGDLLHDHEVPLLEMGDADSPRETLFRIHLAPNMLLVGFDLTEAEIKADDFVWWFTLSENPTEPRFGLDESREGGGAPQTRDDLTWADFAVEPGGFLRPGVPAPVSFTDGPPPGGGGTLDTSQWARSSAEAAWLLFQLPARAAYKGQRMLDAEEA